jgi:hypothetical protein
MNAKEYRVNVYDNRHERREVIARVRYNQNLDYYNGADFQNGGFGRHKGLTKLKDGRYVIIIGTDWQGQQDHAYVVAPDEALQEILRSQNLELLKTKKFKELKRLYEKTLPAEEPEAKEEL